MEEEKVARRSIEDVMNDIEDFLASCRPAGLSSNKIAVPRDEFEDLFGELKIKIPAEIDRCKKIMRNKEAILMNARKEADTILAETNITAQQMVSETLIMQQANQQAYEIVEMAKAQANEIVSTAVEQSNEIRLGSMQYTNDIMMGLRNYVEATMEAERANYENLLATLNNDYVVANANLDEIQRQIVEFTGDPNSVTKAPEMKTVSAREARPEPRTKTSVAQKVRQAVGMREQKNEVPEEPAKPVVEIPDFVTSGETVVPNETPLEATVLSNGGTDNQPLDQNDQVKASTEQAPVQPANVQAGTSAVEIPDRLRKDSNRPVASTPAQPVQSESKETPVSINSASAVPDSVESAVIGKPKVAPSTMPADANADVDGKKVKKKIIKKRNPVIHTPQSAQEAVAKTVEAANANKTEKTVYKANGEQAREVPPMEGKVTRGPRVGRGEVSETTQN